MKLEEMSAFFDKRYQIYDEAHIRGIDGGMESKRLPAAFLPDDTKTLLDLGVGTGLELEEVFHRFPKVQVTGLDISSKMLEKLTEKYPAHEMSLHCMSYFEYEFGCGRFDAALSVMTLHHYTHAVKIGLYRRILTSLKPGGVYVECDYMITAGACNNPQEIEDSFFAEYDRLKREQELAGDAEYHFDTPCTVENQKKLLLQAGFLEVAEVWSQKNTVILVAKKR